MALLRLAVRGHAGAGRRSAGPRAFSLTELIVVLGIISLLVSMLLPALAKARSRARMLQCQSNLKQVAIYLTIYASEWRGALFPPSLGDNVPREQRWPVYAIEPHVWNPPLLKCPADSLLDDDLPPGQFGPGEDHSYVLNGHLSERRLKAGDRIGALSTSEVVLMGEKITTSPDYYVEVSVWQGTAYSEFARTVELHRHGLSAGSNYLYVDMHVGSNDPPGLPQAIDPWDVEVAPATQPGGGG